MVSRYRSLMLLVAVLFSQLLLMAYQLRRKQDIPLVRAAVVYVVAPVQRGMTGIAHGFRDVWGGYVSLWGTHRQNQIVTRENDDLKLENQRLREQAAEGKRLQVLFDLREQIPLPTIVARVLSAGSSETARIILIDKGANDGLKPDLPVMVSDGVVGKILHLFPTTAQVLLVTDPYSGVACLLQDSRVHGILKGQNKPLCSLTYVPNGDAVKPGQVIFTSGEDQIYPKGLPLGVVVEARPGPEFQQITVQPLAQLNRLEEVLVIMQSGGEIANFPIASNNASNDASGIVQGPTLPTATVAGGAVPGSTGGGPPTAPQTSPSITGTAAPRQSQASPALTGNLPGVIPAAPPKPAPAVASPNAASPAPKPAAPVSTIAPATTPVPPPQRAPAPDTSQPPTPPAPETAQPSTPPSGPPADTTPIPATQ